jgi:hypothetical protein
MLPDTAAMAQTRGPTYHPCIQIYRWSGTDNDRPIDLDTRAATISRKMLTGRIKTLNCELLTSIQSAWTNQTLYPTQKKLIYSMVDDIKGAITKVHVA